MSDERGTPRGVVRYCCSRGAGSKPIIVVCICKSLRSVNSSSWQAGWLRNQPAGRGPEVGLRSAAAASRGCSAAHCGAQLAGFGFSPEQNGSVPGVSQEPASSTSTPTTSRCPSRPSSPSSSSSSPSPPSSMPTSIRTCSAPRTALPPAPPPRASLPSFSRAPKPSCLPPPSISSSNTSGISCTGPRTPTTSCTSRTRTTAVASTRWTTGRTPLSMLPAAPVPRCTGGPRRAGGLGKSPCSSLPGPTLPLW
ncbi:hypothetical protein UVI_02023600 [Ustilaginoidea virens]|uniref:Uncharacterized protein n=1 Tax=Ustilaginoidea virens TaxID=1159556 RepID=A0A1B5KZL7_USTVR|nr:hypothetical protein UVI_02023600 [Ustilaginoidea virens]